MTRIRVKKKKKKKLTHNNLLCKDYPPHNKLMLRLPSSTKMNANKFKWNSKQAVKKQSWLKIRFSLCVYVCGSHWLGFYLNSIKTMMFFNQIVTKRSIFRNKYAHIISISFFGFYQTFENRFTISNMLWQKGHVTGLWTEGHFNNSKND